VLHEGPALAECCPETDGYFGKVDQYLDTIEEMRKEDGSFGMEWPD